MISFFAVPKAFKGHIGIIQRNAIENWSRLAPGVQVILVGDEPGISEAAAAVGAIHVPDVTKSRFGAPLLDDVFHKATRLAVHDTLCFVNADILFRGDVAGTIAMAKPLSPFVVIGESTDTDVRERLPFAQSDWREKISPEGRRRGPLAIDFFFFSRGVFDDVPPFAAGRARFDNWLVWSALDRDDAVIDATVMLDAVHQHHDYDHLSGGRWEAYRGPDARRNEALAGLRCYLHLHSTADARFIMSSGGVRRRRWRFSFLRQLWLRVKGLIAPRSAGPCGRR